MNVVVNAAGDLIEVQATAEGRSFRRDQLDELLDLAFRGTDELMRIQAEVLASS
jgi:ribonuclease PH